MKKIFRVIIFVTAIALSGCGLKTDNQINKINSQTDKTKEVTEKNNQQKNIEKNNVAKAIKTSIEAMLQSGNQISCKFTTSDYDNGTIFISGEGKQLLIKIEPGNISNVGVGGNMIFINLLFDFEKNITYSWTENSESRTSGQNSVSKTSLDNFMNKYGKDNSKPGISLKKEFDYYCSSWDMDPKLIDPFSPPKNSDFIDKNDMQEVIENLTSNLKM